MVIGDSSFFIIMQENFIIELNLHLIDINVATDLFLYNLLQLLHILDCIEFL